MKSLSRASPNRVGAYITLVLLLGYYVGTITSKPWAEPCSNNPRPPECPDDCDHNKYYVGGDGMCKMCLKCGPGEELDKPCGNGQNGDAMCKPCEEGHFSSEWDYECIPCRICTNTEELNTCRLTGDRECGDCLFGYYRGSSAFFDPNACPDSCEHNDPSEPLCREWWQWKAQQGQTTEPLRIVPQDAAEEGPNIPETAPPQADSQQGPIDPENQVVGNVQINDKVANELNQEADVSKDSTSDDKPYVTIIITLSTTLIMVIIGFSVALGLVYFRRTQPTKSIFRSMEGRRLLDLPESPILRRSGNSSPRSEGSPETGKRLSNYNYLPESVLPFIIRPRSLSSSTSDVVGHSTETSSAESTSKLRKAMPQPCEVNEETSVNGRPINRADTKVVTEGLEGGAVACNDKGNTELRRRSSGGLRFEDMAMPQHPKENDGSSVNGRPINRPDNTMATEGRKGGAAAGNVIGESFPRRRSGSGPHPEDTPPFLRRRPSPPIGIDLDSARNGRHQGSGSKEPEAALFSDEGLETIAEEGEKSSTAAVRPKPNANDPQVPTEVNAPTSPDEASATAGTNNTDVAPPVVKRKMTQGRATENQEKQRSPNPTSSAAHIHITIGGDVSKVQIGDEHHHIQENEPLIQHVQAGNVEDHAEDEDDSREHEQLLS